MSTGIFKGSHSIARIVYGRHRGEVFVDQNFSYTGADQHFTVPAGSTAKFEVNGAGSRSAKGGRSTGTKYFEEETELSIVVGARGNNGNGGKYGFSGGANGGSNAAGGGLSGVFTGSAAVGNNDGARALIVAGGAGGSSYGTGGAGGGTTGGTGTGSYGNPGAGGTQTGRGSGGNAGSGQFGGGGGSGTYGYGGGGGRWGGNGSQGDGSGDDDKGGGGGSGYVGRVDEGVTTQGGGSAAGVDGSVKISYTIPTLIPTDYVEGYLGSEKIRPGTQSIRLPLEYQELEYIQSTSSGAGTSSTGQYINTGYKPNNKTKVEFKVGNWTNTGTSSNDLFSSDETFSVNGFGLLAGYYNFYAGVSFTHNFNDTNIHIGEFSQQGLYKDGQLLVTPATYTFQSNTPLCLFALNRSGTISEHSTARLYYFKIYNDGTLVRDLIPCYRRIDLVTGMYDLVNNVFYANSGSGTFIRGPEVLVPTVNNGYTEVEYIQSTATSPGDASSSGQYIDTGYIDSINTTVQVDMAFNSLNVQSRLFGHGMDSDYGGYTFEAYINGSSQWARGTKDGQGNWQTTNVAVDTIRHVFTLDKSKYTIHTNGSLVHNGANDNSPTRTNTWSITLLARRFINGSNSSKIQQHSSAKLYGCKIWENGKIVRFYIPCFRNSDNKPGLYDIITKQFLVNAGTGEFTRGNIIKYYRLTDNTICFFPFEINANDSKGNRTVTLSGSSVTGGALDIPNQTSYGMLNSVVNNSIISISVLYYYGGDASGGKWNTLFAHIGGSYHHILFPAHTDSGTIGNIGFYNSGWNPSSKTLTKNKWYHIVTTKNGTNQKMYVNGVLVQNATSFNNATSGCELGMIGNYNSGQSQGPIGKMKEVIFENIEWDINRIQNLYSLYKDDFNLD